MEIFPYFYMVLFNVIVSYVYLSFWVESCSRISTDFYQVDSLETYLCVCDDNTKLQQFNELIEKDII